MISTCFNLLTYSARTVSWLIDWLSFRTFQQQLLLQKGFPACSMMSPRLDCCTVNSRGSSLSLSLEIVSFSRWFKILICQWLKFGTIMQQMSPDHAMARNTKSQERRTTVRRNNGVSSPFTASKWWQMLIISLERHWQLIPVCSAYYVGAFCSRLASLRMRSDSWPSIWMLIIRCIHHCHSLSICGFLDFDRFWSFTIFVSELQGMTRAEEKVTRVTPRLGISAQLCSKITFEARLIEIQPIRFST